MERKVFGGTIVGLLVDDVTATEEQTEDEKTESVEKPKRGRKKAD